MFLFPQSHYKKNPPVFHTALVSQGTLHGGFLSGTDAGAGVVVLLVGLFLTLRVSNLLPELALKKRSAKCGCWLNPMNYYITFI